MTVAEARRPRLRRRPPGPCRQATPRVAVAALALLALVTTAACSGGDHEQSATPTATPTATARPFALAARVTRVSGDLPAARRDEVARQVGAVVSSYVQHAFLGTSPEADRSEAFVDFTPGARTRVRRDLDLVTAAGLDGAESVTAPRAAAYVSVLAPRGRAVGATARLEVDLEVERADGRVTVPVRGRLLLVPGADGWRIFGYDLSRGDAAAVEGSTP